MRYVLFMLLMFPAIASSADDLGRLFTTPAQRENLDHLRKIAPKMVPPVVQPEAAADEDLPPALPSSVSVQGYVKRSDGKKGTVWVNNTPVQENSSTDEVEVGKVTRGNQVPLKVPGIGNLNLKAGQVYDPETNSVVEINAHSNPSLTEGDVGTIGSSTSSALSPNPIPYSEANKQDRDYLTE